tara:strand:- start:73 stop:417 length:345 start_codon:yes stop_codon:yes gene_type:complete
MLKCPSCQAVSFASIGGDSDVLESRNRDTTPYLRRRRQCKKCGECFTTREYEVNELLSIMNGARDDSLTLEASETHLASIVSELEDTLKELTTWSTQVSRHRANLKRRKKDEKS